MTLWSRALLLLLSTASACLAETPPVTVDVWPNLPPGETTLSRGDALPTRATERPPATRIRGITQPTLEIYKPSADRQTGRAVLIFPGGAYNYCVVDKEGSEPARWLNTLGVTGIVLKYRTKNGSMDPPWVRPLQDAQRSVSLVRQRAQEWKLNPNEIGVMGFSAGGQLAALASTRFDQRSYTRLDDTDGISCRPDFSMLIYPWNLYDPKTRQLIPELTLNDAVPSAFLLHTHDDSSTSLGSVYFYAALKERKRPAELHVFHAGGHGYGLRPVVGTNIDGWPSLAGDWLKALRLDDASKAR